MKVLMLGWEYPPHLTGGLGTACRGLAEALSGAGCEVLFVVPHEFGDEPRSRVELIGCNRFATARAETASHAELARRTVHDALDAFGQPSADEDRPGWLAQVAVDSALRPYESSGVFAARRSGVPVGGGATARPRSGRALRALGQPPPLAMETAAGGYGATLFDEVEAYAARVLVLAPTVAFDLIHAHDWMTWPAAMALARAHGKPLVCHVHACEHDRAGEQGDARIRAIEAAAFAAADRVVCVSHFTAAELRRHYGVDPAKLRVVHNAFRRRVAQRRQRLLAEGRIGRQGPSGRISDPLILFLGRVTAQKGPERFLEAAARVAAVVPGARFVLGGDGDLLASMVERAAELGLARSVRFTGFVDEDEVTTLFASAAVYVMPSVSEPFGLAPLEALAQDVPVIVPERSGVAEVLTHALKVDPADVDELSDAILALIQRPALAQELVLGGRRELRRLRWGLRARSLLDAYAELVPTDPDRSEEASR